jgi:hypothetical protein
MMIFPYTFENKALTWYFNLLVGSITNWVDFQNFFLDKFGEETTTGALMTKLFALNMGSKERVKYFNQIFTTLLNKFKTDTKFVEELQVDVYVNALPTPISMFVKRVGKCTLA